MAKVKCPECNGDAKCYCKPGGTGKAPFDQFFLICDWCGHRESVKKVIGAPDALFGIFSDEYPNCPFCNQVCTLHEEHPS